MEETQFIPSSPTPHYASRRELRSTLMRALAPLLPTPVFLRRERIQYINARKFANGMAIAFHNPESGYQSSPENPLSHLAFGVAEPSRSGIKCAVTLRFQWTIDKTTAIP